MPLKFNYHQKIHKDEHHSQMGFHSASVEDAECEAVTLIPHLKGVPR